MKTLIVHPAMCQARTGKARAFVHIEYSDDGRLSMRGVVGPLAYGNTKGACGQCIDEIRNGTPVKGWTREMLDRLCDLWSQWHLNTMRPECEHQLALGWDKLAGTKVPQYNYVLSQESVEEHNNTERAARDAIRRGESFTPTPEQTYLANLPYELKLPTEIDAVRRPYYKDRDVLVTTTILGALKPDRHPDGLLTKPCPVCGYRYGTAWNTVDVPQDVLDWLFALPPSPYSPAWI